jgi:SAM-dependent methyltransferase
VSFRTAVRALRTGRRPVLWGSFTGTGPIGAHWGADRGEPIDRWYISRFLDQHRADITGRVLEVKDSSYTDRFGTGVEVSAVIDIDSGNERATVIADLASGDGLPDNEFDCFILTQTLQFVFDASAALRQAHRVLRPGGVLLLTVPVTSRVCAPPLTDFWRFTPLAVERLLAAAFPGGSIAVRGEGNVLSQVGFLEGLAAEDVPGGLEVDDPLHPLIVCARAVKSA